MSNCFENFLINEKKSHKHTDPNSPSDKTSVGEFVCTLFVHSSMDHRWANLCLFQHIFLLSYKCIAFAVCAVYTVSQGNCHRLCARMRVYCGDFTTDSELRHSTSH